ncbi:MAG: hypothetical protein V4638_04365 [Bacteroidota bacterium]
MNKLIIFVVSVQLNFSFAQVIQNGVSTPKEELMEVPSVQTESKKESTADKQFKTTENNSQQIESAVSTYSITRDAAKKSRTQRTPTSYNQKQMDVSVDILEKSAPNSFEYHLFTYLAGNYNVDLIEHLNKAEKLQANSTEVLTQKAAYFIIKQEGSKALSYLEKLVGAKTISKDVLNYAEDLLRSVPQNGYLITHGFDDTYGALYQQLKKKVRADVTIVSLDLLQSDYFRTQLKKKGLKFPERTTIDVDFLKQFTELNEQSNLSLATTVPKEYLAQIASKLFVTGLVFTYSASGNFDNYTKNKELWSNELKKYGINDVQTDKGKQLSANYLPMLLQLANSGALLKQDVKELDKVIDKIAKQSNKTEQVKKLKTY